MKFRSAECVSGISTFVNGIALLETRLTDEAFRFLILWVSVHPVYKCIIHTYFLFFFFFNVEGD